MALFILMSLLPSLILYLIFDGVTFKWVIASFLLIWGIVYLYLDKFLLALLKAREVRDTEEQFLFQSLKNESYKMKMSCPKVYLYTGFSKNCFVLQSRNEWVIALERSLLSSMNEAQKREFANFVYLYKNTNMALIQTKVMGICTLFFKCAQFLISKIVWGGEKARFFKILYVFVLGLAQPLLLPVEILGKRKSFITVGIDLKPIYNQLGPDKHSLSDYISLQVFSNISNDELMISYLEGFPTLENCRFDETVY